MDIEPIAADRYRLRAHNQVITVSAQDLCALTDWCRLHSEQLEQEAKAALRNEAEAKGWPGEDEEERLHLLMQAGMHKQLQVLTNGPQVDASGEPLLERCPHCRQMHQVGTTDMCPLNPANKPVAAYQAIEAALKLLTGNILNMRTELLVIKAEIMKGDEL